MSDRLLKYMGKCPKQIQRPIPFVQKCLATDIVVFDPTAWVTEEEAEHLLSLGDAFQVADDVETNPPVVIDPEKFKNSITKKTQFDPAKFKTEEEGILHMEIHGINGKMRKIGVTWKIQLLDPQCEVINA